MMHARLSHREQPLFDLISACVRLSHKYQMDFGTHSRCWIGTRTL